MAFANQNKQAEKRGEIDAMVLALTKAGFDPTTAAVLARNPQAAALSISTDNAAKSRGLAEKAMGEVDSLIPYGFGAAPSPVATPGARQRVGGLAGMGGTTLASSPSGPAPALPEGITPDEDKAIRTVIGEAAGEGVNGWKSVAGVIANRAKGGRMSLTDVVLAPNQFEPWSSRRKELEGYDPQGEKYRSVAASVLPVLRGQEADPTGGATHFYAPKAQRALGRRAPSWDNGTGVDIGNHRFFALGYGGQGAGRHGISTDDPSVPNAGPGVELAYRAPGGRVQMADASNRVPMPTPDRTTGSSNSTTPVMQQQTLETQPPAGTRGGLDAGSFYRVQMAAKSNPNLTVDQVLGPATMQANPGLFTGPNGTPLTGNTGRAMRLADRLQEVLPPDLWQETQRGYLGRIVGDAVDPRRVVDNIQAALSGEGRGLSYKLLTDGQVAGLRNIQTGLRTAASIREGVPAWVRDLGKTDFDPAAVVQNLLGKGTTTGNVASGQYARGIRDMAGPESETWASVRQAAWQHLTAKPEGATADFGPQALANRISDFLDGKGRSLATVLYSAEERATMKAFAGVMKTITPARIAGGSASPNSDTAPMMMKAMEALQRHQGKINMLLAGLGFAKGGPAGAAAAYGAAKGVGEAAKAMAARKALKSAQEAASGAPATPMGIPVDRPLTGLVSPADRLLLQGMD